MKKKKKNNKVTNKTITKKSEYGLGRLLCDILLISLFVAGGYATLIKYHLVAEPTIKSFESKLDVTENVNIGIGEKFSVNQSDVSNEKLVWRSLDDTIAKVDNGIIEAVSEGSTNVTVEDEEGNIRTIYVYVNKDNIVSRANLENSKSFVISYNINGGTTSKSNVTTTCTTGKSCAISGSIGTKSGYDFIGWTTKSNGTNDGYNWTGWSGTWNFKNGQYGISNNRLTLYAMWDKKGNKANRYTITYNANGGSGTMKSQVCIANQTCTIRANTLTRSGYTFSGFATTPDTSKAGYNWTGWTGPWKYKNGQYGIKDNKLVLYARWKKNSGSSSTSEDKVTIIYKANGGYGSMDTTTCTKGKSCTIASNKFTKSGYKFIKWRTTASTSVPGYNWTGWKGTWNFTNGQYGINNNTLVLYATWEKSSGSSEPSTPTTGTQFKIIYKANGGSGSMDNTICTKGQKCTVAANKFTRKGYKFTKWRTNASTNVAAYNWTNWSGTWNFSNGQYGVKDNELILYATWEKEGSSTTGDKFTITYDANGGKGSMPSHTCTKGTTCSIKSNSFTKSNYVFAGWTTNSNGKDDGYKWTGWSGTWKYTNGQYGIKNNSLKLYAMWKKKETTPTAPTSSYDVTTDTRFNGYKQVTSYKGSTMSYKLVAANGNDFMLVHVSDPTKQLKTAFPKYGAVYTAENILKAEIQSYGYSNKAMVAVNASFFNMGGNNQPCGKYMLNKGKEMAGLLSGAGGTVAGLGNDGKMRSYGFNGSNNSSVKSTIINAGVKNTWAVFGDILSWDGTITKNNGGDEGTNRTVLCQYDTNNFILFSGHGKLYTVANTLKSVGCKYAVNLDGGGSRKLYYKTNTQGTMTKRFGGGRLIPDMLYFVEQ